MVNLYSEIIPFGSYRNTWIPKYYSTEETVPWRIKLNERLDILLRDTFIESAVTDALEAHLYQEDFSVNSSTIEGSLLLLKNYLGFTFPEPAEVVRYLVQHRNLTDILLYACVLTEETFGSTAQISLELYSDPEINDEYLTIYVRQNTYEQNIIEKIDSISEEYTKYLDIDQGYLLVTTDFQPPRE